MTDTQAVRVAFTETLLKLAREDETLFAVATDSRGSVTPRWPMYLPARSL